MLWTILPYSKYSEKSGQAPLDVKPPIKQPCVGHFPRFYHARYQRGSEEETPSNAPAAQGYAAWADLFSAMALAEGEMMIGWLHIPQDGAPVR